MDRILPTYPPGRSRPPSASSSGSGVEVRTDDRGSTDVDERVSVGRAMPAATEERIPTRTVLWAAGVQASSFAQAVADGDRGRDGQGRPDRRSGRT